MNSQNNPIKQTSVLSAASTKSVVTVLRIIALSLLGVGGAYASQALFTDSYSSVESDATLAQFPAVVRSRAVSLNPDGLALDEHTPARLQQEEVVLNLFDNASFNAKLDHVEYRSEGNYTVYGKITGIPFSDVILTYVDGILTGHITVPQKTFQVRSTGKNQYAVYEIDQSKFPNEADPLPLPESVSDGIKAGAAVNSLTSQAAIAEIDDGSIVDVLVVYTTAAKNAAPNIEGDINTAINQTNLAYTNSKINHRIRLVGTMEKTYTESNLGTALNDVTFNMADVQTKRASVAADLVVMITQTTNGATTDYCGQGWEMNANISDPYKSFAFSVVPRSCATTNYSFAHVVARNLGAKPDCFVDTSVDKPYPYNHGYVDRTNGWRTIMAFKNECDSFGVTCNRIPYFSNPAVSYNGAPTGNSTGTCQANVAGTFANTALTVSQYYSGYCDMAGGYVERANVYPAASASNLYIRTNPLNNYYLSFNTADAKLTDAAVKALTHRGRVAVRGNQSCFFNAVDYGGVASYLYLAP